MSGSSRIEADNPAAAEAFRARIRHWIEVIRQHPQAGHRHPKRREIRTVVESPIIIYYTVSVSRIEILRFWHFSQKSKINSLSLAVASGPRRGFANLGRVPEASVFLANDRDHFSIAGRAANLFVLGSVPAKDADARVRWPRIESEYIRVGRNITDHRISKLVKLFEKVKNFYEAALSKVVSRGLRAGRHRPLIQLAMAVGKSKGRFTTKSTTAAFSGSKARRPAPSASNDNEQLASRR